MHKNANEAEALKNRLQNIKNGAIDERKISFKVESEISERDDEEDENGDGKQDENDLEGLSGAEKNSASNQGATNRKNKQQLSAFGNDSS